MDRRQEFRRSVNEPVRVSSLEAPRSAAVGRIRDMSDNGMRLALTGYFPVGSRIELECKDWVLRGTVIYSFPSKTHGVDAYDSLGIRIEHVTWEPAELSCAWLREWLAEPSAGFIRS